MHRFVMYFLLIKCTLSIRLIFRPLGRTFPRCINLLYLFDVDVSDSSFASWFHSFVHNDIFSLRTIDVSSFATLICLLLFTSSLANISRNYLNVFVPGEHICKINFSLFNSLLFHSAVYEFRNKYVNKCLIFLSTLKIFINFWR